MPRSGAMVHAAGAIAVLAKVMEWPVAGVCLPKEEMQ